MAVRSNRLQGWMTRERERERESQGIPSGQCTCYIYIYIYIYIINNEGFILTNLCCTIKGYFAFAIYTSTADG